MYFLICPSQNVFFVRCNFSCSGLWFYLPSEIHVCCLFVYSAISQPCAVRLSWKLGGDLGLVSQISLHVLVSRFDCFSYCKQTNTQKTWVFSTIPSLIDLKAGGDIQMSTRNSVVRFFCLYYCLFTFHKQRKHTLWIIWLCVGQIFWNLVDDFT
jgi:hypothetical protein